MASSRRSSSTPIITVVLFFFKKPPVELSSVTMNPRSFRLRMVLSQSLPCRRQYQLALFLHFSLLQTADILASILTLFSEIARVRFSRGSQPSPMRNTGRPSFQVSSTRMSRSSSGGAARGSRSRTTRSARSPAPGCPCLPPRNTGTRHLPSQPPKRRTRPPPPSGPGHGRTGHPDHSTPDGLQNVRRSTGASVWEGEGDPQRRRGACGADARRPPPPQVLRWMSPQWYTWPAKKEGITPSRRTSGTWSRPSSWRGSSPAAWLSDPHPPGRGLQRRQILCAGGVSVAVGQQLHVLRPGPTDHIQHLPSVRVP